MEQKNEDRKWENKSLREARESSHKNAVSLLDIAERIGLLKKIETLEDLFVTFNGIRNQLFDQIYQDIPMHADELFDQPKQKEIPEKPQKIPPTNAPPKTPASEPNDATEGMKKAIWAITFGNDDPTLIEELKKQGLNRFNTTKKFINYNWAHDFIEKHKTQ